MIKTYLGLPKRVTGIPLTRKQYEDICESFPALLDAMEAHVADKLEPVDLGVIEWYHRLRNQLYHQGNGLTVEREKVELYAEIAKQLLANLFGVALAITVSPQANLVGEFLAAWAALERSLRTAARRQGAEPHSLHDVMRSLEASSVMAHDDRVEISNLYWLRNRIVHGEEEFHSNLTSAMVKSIRAFADTYGQK